MKKRLAIICVFTLLLSLCACGSKRSENGGHASNLFNKSQAERIDSDTGTALTNKSEGLSVLTRDVYPYCNTEDGYYYIPTDLKQLRDGSYGSAIIYMDFATKKELLRTFCGSIWNLVIRVRLQRWNSPISWELWAKCWFAAPGIWKKTTTCILWIQKAVMSAAAHLRTNTTAGHWNWSVKHRRMLW